MDWTDRLQAAVEDAIEQSYLNGVAASRSLQLRAQAAEDHASALHCTGAVLAQLVDELCLAIQEPARVDIDRQDLAMRASRALEVWEDIA